MMRYPLLVLIPALLMAAPAQAIVDVHDEFYSDPGEDAFAVFAFDFDGASGTKKQRGFEFEAHAVLRRGYTSLLLVGATEFDETNDVESDNSKFAHVRAAHHFAGRHGVELFAQHAEDKFEQLERRDVIGGGYRFEWKPGTDDERGLLGIGLLRERERYLTSVVDQRLWRGNLYITAAVPLDLARGSSIGLSLYAQPDLEDFGDRRAVMVLTFKASLSDRLGIKASLDYKHDSDPEPGIDSSTLEYSAGVTYTLK